VGINPFLSGGKHPQNNKKINLTNLSGLRVLANMVSNEKAKVYGRIND
jgi:hypothetical protein